MAKPSSLFELIPAVKPRLALFTTYTFSVSYFDSVFVPLLRSVGCRDTAVLVDASKAARSVEEADSRAAGRMYQLAPVIAPGGGVFHPKMAYLVGANDDVLAISSGNLTASGQALQLETFDAVSGMEAPEVFAELGLVLATLASTLLEKSPQASELLSAIARRASQKGLVPSPPDPTGLRVAPRLVHTIGKTAKACIIEAFSAEATHADEITVLAPFHAPTGAPVLDLAAALGAKRLRIGPLSPEGEVPFEERLFKSVPKTTYIAPMRGGKAVGRRVHAKIFEIKAPGRILIVTGSVNATTQSLNSMRNVEFALARWLTESPFRWKKEEPRGFRSTLDPAEFDDAPRLFIEALLGATGVLEGVLTPAPPDGETVSVTMHIGGSVKEYKNIGVKHGRFRVAVGDGVDTSNAVRITVLHGNNAASCWLTLQEELKLSAVERDRRAAVRRILQGDFGMDDVGRLIQMIAAKAGVSAAVLGGRKSRNKHKSEDADDDELSFANLLDGASGERRQAGGLGQDDRQLLQALRQWLKRRTADDRNDRDQDGTLLEDDDQDERGVAKGMGDDDDVGVDDDDEATRQEANTKQREKLQHSDRELSAMLDKVLLAIPGEIVKAPDREDVGLLVEIAATRAVDRAIREAAYIEPCLAWLDTFSALPFTATTRTALLPLLVAMTAFIATRLSDAKREVPFSSLREAIERMAGTSVPGDEGDLLGRQGLAGDLFIDLGSVERERIAGIGRNIVTARPLDETVIHLVTLAAAATAQDLARNESSLAAVAGALRVQPRRLADGLLDAAGLARMGCPRCNVTLRPEEVSRLRREHYLVHVRLDCGKLIFFSQRPAWLRRELEALEHA